MHGKPFKPGDLVWLCSPVTGKKKSTKLHCPCTRPFKIVKRISALVYRIQNIQSQKRQVVHFEHLKSYSEKMRPRNKESEVAHHKSTLLEEDSNSTPPGTVLQLVEDNNEEDPTEAPPTVNNMDPPILSESADTKRPSRYPQWRNRRKLIRYTDSLS